MIPKLSFVKSLFFLCFWMIITAQAQPADNAVYSQSPSQDDPILQSARWEPDGSDYDQYVWDDFTLQTTAIVHEIDWQGNYRNTESKTTNPVISFTIAIYMSNAAGAQPDFANQPILKVEIDGNAQERALDNMQGYQYKCELPFAFQANAGTTYWIQIVADQDSMPDWGLMAGSGGNGKCYKAITDNADVYYQSMSSDID